MSSPTMISDQLPAAPSRLSNPFSTCWTRPGAIRFEFPAGESVDTIVVGLAAAGWRGEIVGPHGSGKSTLLATLVPRLEEAGRSVSSIVIRAGAGRLPDRFLRRALRLPRPLVIVDGAEQLSVAARWLLRWRCRRAAAGLLVTTHQLLGLPTLVRLEPDRTLVDRLVAALTRNVDSPVTAADVAASHARHGSNVRELLFELYDRHERASRRARTVVARRA